MKENLIKLRRSTWSCVKHYFWGCFAKSWNSAIAAVYAVLGQATGAAFDPAHFSPPDWRTAVYTFGVCFSISAVGYFKDNPLPTELKHSVPPFPTQS